MLLSDHRLNTSHLHGRTSEWLWLKWIKWESFSAPLLWLTPFGRDFLPEHLNLRRAQLQNSGPAYANWSDASVGRDSKQQQFLLLYCWGKKLWYIAKRGNGLHSKIFRENIPRNDRKQELTSGCWKQVGGVWVLVLYPNTRHARLQGVCSRHISVPIHDICTWVSQCLPQSLFSCSARAPYQHGEIKG